MTNIMVVIIAISGRKYDMLENYFAFTLLPEKLQLNLQQSTLSYLLEEQDKHQIKISKR